MSALHELPYMSDKNLPKKEQPSELIWALKPDNFTPVARTPWGGRRIFELKAGLRLAADKAAQRVVGESWELSVGPEFPSVLTDGTPLRRALDAAPERLCGAEADRGSTALLVKLLDTEQNLSVQIHPTDDYPELAPDESGKPEAWYVIAREPGAGLYLGLEADVTETAISAAIAEQQDVSKLLHFVPVEVGDCIIIEPGTAHCIGAGVTLLEPQRVLPGKRGVTYRYWDWNRRYDAGGNLDPQGTARPLHLKHALSVTEWARPRGSALLEQIRYAAGSVNLDSDAEAELLIGKLGRLESSSIELSRLSGTGTLELAAADRLRSMTVLEGSVQIGEDNNQAIVPSGQTVALPACFPRSRIYLHGAHALLCSVN